MNKKMRYLKRGLPLWLMLICFFSMVISVPLASAQGPIATMKFHPGQEVQEAEVAPGSNGKAIFGGEVSCELVLLGIYDRVVVNLSASTENGWETAVDPEQIVFTQNTGDSLPFGVWVYAPIGTSFYVADTVYITGNVTGYPENQNYSSEQLSISGRLHIKQYYAFGITDDDNFVSLTQGDKRILTFNVTNNGNGRDSIQLRVENTNELEAEGVDYEIKPSSFDIEAGETKTIQVTVTTSGETTTRDHQILIEVKSEGEERNKGFASPKRVSVDFTVKKEVTGGGLFGESGDFLVGISIMIIIVVIVVIALTVYFTMGKKRSDRSNTQYGQRGGPVPGLGPERRPGFVPASYKQPQQQQPMQPTQTRSTCPRCFAELRFLNDYNQWYCDRCGEYR